MKIDSIEIFHYRLPLDAPEIPYVWTARTANVVTRGDENRR